ncbi:MAG TPA: hypothetical protein VLV30_06580 [Methanomicrobiales archaeon]|nr:hypothetical protein [Methanomicrobiales archaeon]
MDFGKVLAGKEEPLPVYQKVSLCLENIEAFPYLLESIYREAQGFDEDTLDRFRFALIRLQVYTDLHHYEDMENTQKVRYVAQVLEKVIFGDLLLERERPPGD